MIKIPIDLMKSKLRLWLEYLLLGIILALAGYAVVSAFQGYQLKLQVAQLEKEAVSAKHKRDELEGVIGDLQTARAADAIVLTQLADGVSEINNQNATVKQRVAFLERTDAMFKAYLDSTVPDPSRLCLLDNTCPAGEAGETQRSPATRVRPAQAGPKQIHP